MSHEDATHGPAPLGAVAPAPVPAAVAAVGAGGADYGGTPGRGRAGVGASEADEDPRVLALEARVGALNAQLFDVLHEALGIHPDLTSSVWEPTEGEEADDADAAPADLEDDTFTLEYVVVSHPGGPDLDDVVGLLDSWGHEAHARLTEAGYDVPEWGVGRGTDEHEDDA